MASRVRCYGTRIHSPVRSLRHVHNHHIQKINPFLYLVDHRYPVLSDDLKWAGNPKTMPKEAISAAIERKKRRPLPIIGSMTEVLLPCLISEPPISQGIIHRVNEALSITHSQPLDPNKIVVYSGQPIAIMTQRIHQFETLNQPHFLEDLYVGSQSEASKYADKRSLLCTIACNTHDLVTGTYGASRIRLGAHAKLISVACGIRDVREPSLDSGIVYD